MLIRSFVLCSFGLLACYCSLIINSSYINDYCFLCNTMQSHNLCLCFYPSSLKVFSWVMIRVSLFGQAMGLWYCLGLAVVFSLFWYFQLLESRNYGIICVVTSLVCLHFISVKSAYDKCWEWCRDLLWIIYHAFFH